MLAWGCAIFLVVGFFLVSKVLGLVDKSTRVFSVAKNSIEILKDSALDDEAKERAIQACAKELIALFLIITIGSALALVVPFVLVYAISLIGPVSVPQVIELTLSWLFISVVCTASLLYFFWGLHRKKQKS